MEARFRDKVIFITGAGSGLGRECARQWSAQGGVIVVTDLVESRAHAVQKEIEVDGGTAISFKVDVTVEADLEEAVEATIKEFGRLDVMFANAGRSLYLGVPLEDVSEKQWEEVNNIVYRGVFFSGKHACRVMKGRGGGNIVVTTSAAGLNAYPQGFGPYAAGKSGAIGLVKGMAGEWGKYGIRVNGLAPTHGMSINFGLPLDAPVLGMSYEEAIFAKLGRPWGPDMFAGPLKVERPPGLRDNAAVATFLASDDSYYMSGVVIPSCDGGNFAITSIHFTPDWSFSDMVAGILADARQAEESS
jgi:NAD(P)-dependent dehydrogenase (short-subunit alcohol dehydrogenase family)